MAKGMALWAKERDKLIFHGLQKRGPIREGDRNLKKTIHRSINLHQGTSKRRTTMGGGQLISPNRSADKRQKLT